jgi:hypothetical protein
MAIATIKDLMDPLSKIQAATESTAETLDAFTTAINAQMQGSVSFFSTMLKNSDEQTALLRTISAGGVAGGGKASSASKSAEEQTSLLRTISVGVDGGKDTAAAKTADEQTSLLRTISVGGVAGTTGGAMIKTNTDTELAEVVFNGDKVMLGKLDEIRDINDGSKFATIRGWWLRRRAWKYQKKTDKTTISLLTKLVEKQQKGGGKGTKDPAAKKGSGIKEKFGALASLAVAIGAFALALAKAAVLLPIGLIGAGLLILSIKILIPTFEKLGKKQKVIKKGGRALEMMGIGLNSFARGLTLAALIALPGLILSPVLILAILLIGGAIGLLGTSRVSKSIKKGARNLDRMGDALKSFAIGLALTALIAMVVIMKPEILLGIVASMVLIGGAIALLGMKKVSKAIRKGSLNLIILSGALLIYGFAYGIFASSFPAGVGLMDVIIQAAAIGLIGGAAALVGKFDIKTILKGAAALALNGIALVIFSFGYKKYAKATEGVGLKDVLVQSLVILGIGFAAAIVGKFGVGTILQGALAMVVNGAGLWVFSLGYKPYAEATKGMSLGDVGIQLAVLTGIGLVMGVAGLAVAASAGTVMLGPALYAAAGGALLLLAPGLKAMRELKFNEDDAKNLTYTLGAVAMAFSGVKEDDGFFGAIGSAFAQVGKGATTLAAAAGYAAAGGALILLSKGLNAFKSVSFDEEDSKTLVLALGSISAAFAQAGGEPSSPGGLFGAVFGSAFSPNATKKGIDSVMDAGDALTSIAKGLTAFQALVKTEINFDEIGLAISNTVGFVQKAFAAVAGEGNVEAGGFFGSLFGIKKNKVQEGIDSVQGAGSALTDIAGGLASFKGLKDPAGTAVKIKSVLGLVGQAFASIGGQEETDGNWFISWDENLVEKGIDAVDGAGKALTDIAAGLKAFSGDFDPISVATSVATLLTSIGTAFSDLYKTNPFISTQLVGFSSFIVTLGDVAEKGLLDKAADGISKIADSINKIDIDKTVAFGDLFNSSSKLSSDSKAYQALADAVEEIRDIMQEQKEPGLLERGLDAVGLGGDKNKPAISKENQKASGADPMKKLNATLGQINSTLSKLPTAIAQIQLEIVDPG